ncbi:MAG: GGDEF domain-containing protein [Rhodoferax sp.]|nr:GGDEF domain-containing protein [Rhodoferax sp.]
MQAPAMPNELDQAQLFRYAQDLQELMDQHAQLQQHHTKVLELLRQGSLDSEALKDLALHDPLTALPNRRLLEQRLKEAIRRPPLAGSSVYVLYMDLDRFKPINDSLGHDVGDLVLQVVGQRLQAGVRRDDTVARVGGDEFVVVLQNMASHEVVLAIVLSLLHAIAEPIAVGDHSLEIGVSIGCAHHPYDGESVQDLLKHADAAMYEAKRSKTGYAFFNAPPLPVGQSQEAAKGE